jgi:hypothetical protein
MSNSQAVNVECYGTVQRIPLTNPFIRIDKLKSILCSRLNIDYSFNLTYEGAELCNQDTLHDLALNPAHPIRVRRCSIDNSYVTDSMTDVFLSYEQTYQDIVIQMKQKLEEKNYYCWLDVEEMSGDTDHFCSAIEQGIQRSTVFVCCITSRYVRSTKCRQELSFAKQHEKRIILLMMEELHWPPQQIGSLVSGLSYIKFYNTASSGNLTSWPPEKFDELLSKLGDLAPQL